MNRSDTCEDANCQDGTKTGSSRTWVFIKHSAGSAWYMARNSLLKKSMLAPLMGLSFLFSPAKLNPQHTAIIGNDMRGFVISEVSEHNNLTRESTLAPGEIDADGFDGVIIESDYRTDYEKTENTNKIPGQGGRFDPEIDPFSIEGIR